MFHCHCVQDPRRTTVEYLSPRLTQRHLGTNRPGSELQEEESIITTIADMMCIYIYIHIILGKKSQKSSNKFSQYFQLDQDDNYIQLYNVQQNDDQVGLRINIILLWIPSDCCECQSSKISQQYNMTQNEIEWVKSCKIPIISISMKATSPCQPCI